ncbi:hypothetical protein FXO37_10387 [Capsicum annuum]|nr:hypothetical protein FXO37_10387 [Capsicum annuum]
MFESYSHLDKELAWHLFRQIVEGLTHIHGQGIIHRDLTPNNIFFDARNDIKIGDFGLAKFLKLEQLDQDVDASEIIEVSVDGTGQVGTYFYTAPEIEQRWPKINEKADMYSLGVVFFELWHPFDTAMERHIVLSDLKQKGEVPPAWAAEYPEQSSLLRRLMSPSPSDRPSAVELLQNAFPPRMEYEMLDILNWQSLCLLQHSRSNCRFVKLAFKFKRHLLIVQDSEYEPPCHPSFTNTVSDILVDLSLSEYRPKIVETIPLLDGPSIKLHYHVSLICHITELALQIFRLGPVQPKSFRLQGRFWSKYPKSVDQSGTDPTPTSFRHGCGSENEESEQLSCRKSDKPPARRNHYSDDFDIEVSGLGLGHFGQNSVFGLPETSGETDLSGSRAGDRVESQTLKNDSAVSCDVVLVPICLDFSRSDSERCWRSCSYPKSILNLGKWVVLRSLQTRYPFRFENMWLRVDDFKDGVAGWRDEFEESSNASFVVIVPKREGALCIKDYRPVSLERSIYKIISKVLSIRRKKVLDEIVSTPKNALYRVDRFLGATLVANEVVDSRRKQGVPGLLCKLDLEKAYDHVASGLKINPSVRFFPSERWLTLGCSLKCELLVGALMATYLRLPQGALHKDVVAWNPVLQKVEKRLAGWQKNTCAKEEPSYWEVGEVAEAFSLGCGGWSKEVSLGVLKDCQLSEKLGRLRNERFGFF